MTVCHVLRYDDFSETSGSRAESWFFERLAELALPCTVAVVPAQADICSEPGSPIGVRALSRSRAAALRASVDLGLVEIALHGYAHLATSHVRGLSEFGSGMDRERQRALIRWGRKYLQDLFGVSIATFVPPWNVYSADTLAVLEEEGFAAISASVNGAVCDGELRYVPGTTSPVGMLQALRRARGRSGALVATVVHDYDFLDAGHGHGLSMAKWEMILAALAKASNVRSTTVGELAGQDGNEFGPARFSQALWRGARLRRLPTRVFDRGRSAVYLAARPSEARAFPTPIAPTLNLSGRPIAVPGLVSVILPVHNRPVMLREAVESVLTQTHREFEILIVDDASTDSTPAVAEELRRASPDVIRVVRQAKNSGPGPGRNRGLEQARGEFIQFLDSDDLLLPEKFERQIEVLRRIPEAGVAYGLSLRYGRDGVKRTSHRTDEEFRSILPHFLWSRGWPTLSPLWRRRVCDQVGGFAPLRSMEDWHYDCRAGLLDVCVASAPGSLAEVRDHPGDRASFGPSVPRTPAQWHDHFVAYRSIADHLRTRGRTEDLGDLRFFKEVFRATRQCGVEGHAGEAETGLRLAASLAPTRWRRGEVVAARAIVRLLGWRPVWQIANLTHRTRTALLGSLHPGPGSESL
jgi:hypothetical protein